MKIRLYRGPLDGKVYDIDGRIGPTLALNYMPKYRRGSKKWLEQQRTRWDYNPGGPEITLDYRTVHYRRTQFQHPDGSVFYEWDQPRGTSIG